MRTYYHVTQTDYINGTDLLSYIAYESEYGETPAYKWGEDVDVDLYTDSLDAQVVCLFDAIDDAQDFCTLYGGKILKIEIPNWAIEERIVRFTKVGEGYTAIFDCIPAEFIAEA